MSKEVLCSDQVLKRYNLNKHTVLITDMSRLGLRYVFIQTDRKLELDASTRNFIKRMPKGALILCGS